MTTGPALFVTTGINAEDAEKDKAATVNGNDKGMDELQNAVRQ